MSSNNPKRHHYIPQMLLKNFVDDNGHLHVFDKKRKKPYSTKPENLFVRKHLYSEWSFEDSSYNQKNEEKLSEIESQAAPIIQRIIECGRKNELPELSLEQADTWKRFYVSLCWRVPEFADKTMKVDKQLDDIVWEEVEKVLTQRGNTPADMSSAYQSPINIAGVQAIKDKCRARLAAVNHPVSQKDMELFSKNIGLGIAVIQMPNRSFIIGSHCISGLEHLNKNDQIHGNWLPVSHDVAICPTPHPDREQLVQLQDKIIKRMNETSFRQSDIIAGKSQTLVHSLARRY